MKTLSLLVPCLLTAVGVTAQQPLSREAALKQLYHDYDAATRTAQWECTSAQTQTKHIEGWPCLKEYATVSIAELLMAHVQEDGVAKVYLVASARPDSSPGGFDCHSCAPAIGAAVFAWQADHWVLQSSNPATGFHGGFGVPPDVDLATIGRERHGVLLAWSDGAQGYAWSNRALLVPVAEKVTETWGIQDEQDNQGAYDPADKLGDHVLYRSSAAFKFFPSDDNGDGSKQYYDIEVVSRGEDRQDLQHPLKRENWTEVYRFSGSKYKLLRHTDFIETKKPAKAH